MVSKYDVYHKYTNASEHFTLIVHMVFLHA